MSPLGPTTRVAPTAPDQPRQTNQRFTHLIRGPPSGGCESATGGFVTSADHANPAPPQIAGERSEAALPAARPPTHRAHLVRGSERSEDRRHNDHGVRHVRGPREPRAAADCRRAERGGTASGSPTNPSCPPRSRVRAQRGQADQQPVGTWRPLITWTPRRRLLPAQRGGTASGPRSKEPAGGDFNASGRAFSRATQLGSAARPHRLVGPLSGTRHEARARTARASRPSMRRAGPIQPKQTRDPRRARIGWSGR